MPSLAPVILSGSINGRGKKVVATATPGTAIHTVSGTSGVIDELWLYATNTDTVTRRITVEFGGVTAPDDTILMDLPPGNGPVCLVAGLRLTGGVLVTAFAAAANVVVVHGNVNRYTP